jgi:hypothetical protein
MQDMLALCCPVVDDLIKEFADRRNMLFTRLLGICTYAMASAPCSLVLEFLDENKVMMLSAVGSSVLWKPTGMVIFGTAVLLGEYSSAEPGVRWPIQSISCGTEINSEDSTGWSI